MRDRANEQKHRAAEKSVVSNLLGRLMGFFGYTSMPTEMQAALDNPVPIQKGGGGPDALAMPLAACVDPVEPEALKSALEQVWPFRHLVGTLFSSKEGRRLAGRMQRRVRERLLSSGQADLSDQITKRQISLLRSWLTDEQPATFKAMATRLHAETRRILEP